MIWGVNKAGSRSAVRLFLALWPDAQVREALVRSREAWVWPAGAALVQPQSLHLTLHFLGAVPVARLPQLRAGLAVPFQPFTLCLDRAALWPRGIAVLQSEQPAAGLLDLHQALGLALRGLELPVEQRALRPHVTLARHAGRASRPAQAQRIDWPVPGYALVVSMPDLPGRYRLLERYA